MVPLRGFGPKRPRRVTRRNRGFMTVQLFSVSDSRMIWTDTLGTAGKWSVTRLSSNLKHTGARDTNELKEKHESRDLCVCVCLCEHMCVDRCWEEVEDCTLLSDTPLLFSLSAFFLPTPTVCVWHVFECVCFGRVCVNVCVLQYLSRLEGECFPAALSERGREWLRAFRRTPHSWVCVCWYLFLGSECVWCFVFPPQKKKTFFSSAAAVEERADERGSAALLLHLFLFTNRSWYVWSCSGCADRLSIGYCINEWMSQNRFI